MAPQKGMVGTSNRPYQKDFERLNKPNKKGESSKSSNSQASQQIVEHKRTERVQLHKK